MATTIPGKLELQGPIATLEGGISFGRDDRFVFNGEQFVQYIASVPSVVTASANKAIDLGEDGVQVISKRPFGKYKDSEGSYRFVNGKPTYEGLYSGAPSGEYDHVVVGYSGPIDTSKVKFWAEEYIPVEIIRVDYGYDGETWYNIPTHAGNVTFEFDSTLRLHSAESSPVGQYIYTIDLGKGYSATYWRIRSFVGVHSMATVGGSSVQGGDIVLSTTSGLPTSSTLWSKGRFSLLSSTHRDAPIWELSPTGKYYQSGARDGISWGDASYDAGEWVLSDVILKENVLNMYGISMGEVYLPGWVDILSVEVMERYGVFSHYERVLKQTEWGPLYSYNPNCWRRDSLTIPDCYSSVCTINGFTFYPYSQECYDLVPMYIYHTDVLGSFLSYDSFYLPSFSTPFRVSTQSSFTSLVTGDIGPHGGLVSTQVVVTSFSGTEPPPAGDPETLSYAFAEVEYSQVQGDTIKNCYSTAWAGYHLAPGTDLDAYTRFMYTYPMKITQVEIYNHTRPVLKYWESDGSLAMVHPMQDEHVFDLVFDGADSVFYAAIFSTGVGAGSNIDDSFGGSSIDRVKWDYQGSAIILDTTRSGISFINTVVGSDVRGSLTSNYYYDGSFDGFLPMHVTSLSGSSYYGLDFVSQGKENIVSFVGIIGDWEGGIFGDVCAGIVDSVINVSDNSFYVSNLNVDPVAMPTGENTHEYRNISGKWYYTRYPGGGVCDVCNQLVGDGPVLSYSGTGLKVNSIETIPTNSYVTFNTNKDISYGVSSSGIIVSCGFDSSSDMMVLSYNDGSYTSVVSGTLSGADPNIVPRIIGFGDSIADVFSSEYYSIGSFLRKEPVLSIVCIDSRGERTSVGGVSDANGVVIGNLDVLSEGLGFSEYRNKIFIGSSQKTSGDGGSLFLLVDDSLYKYSKASLPLGHEVGLGASAYMGGSVSEIDIRNFNYSGYTKGGLHYCYYDRDRDSVYLKEVSSSTLVPVLYEVFLDLNSLYFPLCLDPTDLSTLFTVLDNKVYLLNLDSLSIAFCNVYVSDSVIPAESGYTTTVTAVVSNAYGEVLSGKQVSFSVTAGGGSVSPSVACTNANGEASVTFYADTIVGTSIITATATNTSC